MHIPILYKKQANEHKGDLAMKDSPFLDLGIAGWVENQPTEKVPPGVFLQNMCVFHLEDSLYNYQNHPGHMLVKN
jgi:hypothetical protein